MSFAGKNIAIMGLGKSGLDVASRLIDCGAHVQAWDDNSDGQNMAKKRHIPLTNLNHDDAWIRTQFDMLILSPGIPHNLPTPHPTALHAHNHNVPIMGEVALLPMMKPHAYYIGITGTNGKSTTTALLEHCLQQANVAVQAGGNLAIPALGLPDADVYVLEISSYMAERLNGTKFNVGIFMNLSPDHLDRHGDMDGYLEAKLKMFDGCDDTSTAIVIIDDDYTKMAYEKLNRQGIKTIPISATEKYAGGIYMDDDMMVDDRQGQASVICNMNDMENLVGQHNRQNMMAVYACLTLQGIDKDNIIPAFKTFTALAHRQQFITALNGVRFINDSKATNIESAIRGITSYDNVYWIAGGEGKQSSYEKMTPSLNHISKGYFIGEAENDLAEFFDKTNTPYERCGTLDIAVQKSYYDAVHSDGVRSGENAVVLLSPACASWDQFNSFEQRGDMFAQYVKSLDAKSLHKENNSNGTQDKS